MKTLIFGILTLVPFGYAVSELPPEYQVAQELEEMQLTAPETTSSTSSTTTTTINRGRVSTVLEVTNLPTTSVTPVTSGADGALCPEWWGTARQMGWSDELLPTLDRVIWNESRCIPDATNGSDHGLVQVNWTTWRPLVESFGYTKADLYVPAINLLIGQRIYQAAIDSNYICPWSPWKWSGNYCK